jgi:hypothetical protein
MKNGAKPRSITSACSDDSGTAAAGAATTGHARAASTQAHQIAITAIWMTPVRKKKRCGTANSSHARRSTERAPGMGEDAGTRGSVIGMCSLAREAGGICGGYAARRSASLTRVKIPIARSTEWCVLRF